MKKLNERYISQYTIKYNKLPYENKKKCKLIKIKLKICK